VTSIARNGITIIISGMLIINDLGVIADLYDEDPAQAVSAWLALDAVESGLGGAVELPGGLWVLLISWAALRTGGFPRTLNYLGVVIGVSGIVTLVPALSEAETIFGMGFIIWFVWAGIVMLRGGPSAAAVKTGRVRAAPRNNQT
jgi:hypothetical protein